MHHTDFVYPWNDVRHCILNLFLLSSVGLKRLPYNYPVWSVSVEMVLYVLFYTLCRFNWVRVLVFMLSAGSLPWPHTRSAAGCVLFLDALLSHVFIPVPAQPQGRHCHCLVHLLPLVGVPVGFMQHASGNPAEMARIFSILSPSSCFSP
jgi:hypothetical protein